MEEEKQIARIEAWRSGKLNPDEKAKFEEELTSNIELQDLFEKHKFLLDGFEGMRVQAFADKMRQAQGGNVRKTRARTLWATVAIAASVIALIGITYFMVQSFGTRHLAMEFYAAPLADIQRSGSHEDSFFQKGMLAFAGKDWEKAISAFSQIQATDPDYARGLYFEAHAHVANKDYTKALSLFDDPVFLNSPLQQQAEWNSTLMLMLLQYPKQEIIVRLNRIENNPDHFYKNKATEVLKRL